MYKNDKRVVMTLDAGGTNFVFSAMRGNKEIVEPLTLPSNADNLEKCLRTLETGFSTILNRLKEPVVAISFAFPGPADYKNGIIMDLPNLPAFRGGVALGPFLKAKFGLPVFINNDGDLFAYGECIAGALPETNAMLAQAGSPKSYENLLGFTLGTGFGCGIVRKNELFLGDNGAAGEVWLLRHKYKRDVLLEEGVAIRAIQRVYREESGDDRSLTPKDIFDIAEGTTKGDVEAAKKSFAEFGEMTGEGIAVVATVLDGLVVIGGGLASAKKYFMPALMSELNGTINLMDGTPKPRTEMKAYDLDDPQDRTAFLQGSVTKIKVPETDQLVDFDPVKRMGVVISKLGASKAIALGAYSFALNELDKL
ncbi:MAG TPA: ROK family protein [Bacteroidales bacterium]|nr:ROK family protein [Bacteroidales bacterium]